MKNAIKTLVSVIVNRSLDCTGDITHTHKGITLNTEAGKHVFVLSGHKDDVDYTQALADIGDCITYANTCAVGEWLDVELGDFKMPPTEECGYPHHIEAYAIQIATELNCRAAVLALAEKLYTVLSERDNEVTFPLDHLHVGEEDTVTAYSPAGRKAVYLTKRGLTNCCNVVVPLIESVVNKLNKGLTKESELWTELVYLEYPKFNNTEILGE